MRVVAGPTPCSAIRREVCRHRSCQHINYEPKGRALPFDGQTSGVGIGRPDWLTRRKVLSNDVTHSPRLVRGATLSLKCMAQGPMRHAAGEVKSLVNMRTVLRRLLHR